MDPKRWQQVKEIIEASLEYPQQDRAAFLRKTCGDDERLLQEVSSLLDEGTGAEEFLEEPLFERKPETPGDLPDALPDERQVGPYELLRPLGRGGMGTVYLAARKDDEFEQKVAIKLIKRGMDSAEIVGRFRYERQILANLQHPNIARLLDGGTTSDGLPYFVMEHIEGEPIHRFCNNHQLSISECLELFRTVSNAVEFAHRNLVIHRDLKPANILVTAEGVPKLLDFGIAKLLTPGENSPTTLTSLGGRFLTPNYASPEQLRGEPVTTASDVYSLGIVLYQLLTGRLPYALDDNPTPAALFEATLERHREPPKPSTVTIRSPGQTPPISTEQLTPKPTSPQKAVLLEKTQAVRSQRLPKDLDYIILKALRYEPEKRYQSARELKEDLGRHLEGLPVLARQGSWFYRTNRFVQRYFGRIVAVVVLLSFLVGLGITSFQRRRSELAAEETARFVYELIMASDPERSDLSRTLLDTLDQGPEIIDKAMQQQPEQRAAFLGQLGQIYRRRGELEKAQALVEKSLKLRQATLGENDGQVARSRNSLSLIFSDQGKYEAAEKQALQALTILERQQKPDEVGVAVVLNSLAGVAKDRGNLDEAEKWYRESLEKKRRLPGEAKQEQIPQALNDLGWTLATRGKYQEAEEMLREALAIERQQVGDSPDSPLILRILVNLANVRRDQGYLVEAEKLYRESLALRQERYGSDHPKTASGLQPLAICLQLQGDLESAEDLFQQALQIRIGAFGLNHDLVAAVRRDLASLLTAKGNFKAAELEARRAIEILQNSFPANHWRLADADSVLGSSLLGLGQRAEAEELLRRSYPLLRARKGANARQTQEALERLQLLGDQPM